MFDLFLFYDISNSVVYLMHESFFMKSLWYYLTCSSVDKYIHTFLKGISPQVNVMTRREFEYDVAVQHITHYTTGNLPNIYIYIYVLRSRVYRYDLAEVNTFHVVIEGIVKTLYQAGDSKWLLMEIIIYSWMHFTFCINEQWSSFTPELIRGMHRNLITRRDVYCLK